MRIERQKRPQINVLLDLADKSNQLINQISANTYGARNRRCCTLPLKSAEMFLIWDMHSEEQQAINTVQWEKEDMGFTGSEGKKEEDVPEKMAENRMENRAPGSTCPTDINTHTHTPLSRDNDSHSLSLVIASQSRSVCEHAGANSTQAAPSRWEMIMYC